MEKFIPLSVPNITGNEIKYVSSALQDEWVSTAGSMIIKFEEAIQKYVNVNKACAVQSGTSGLHLSLLATGVKANEEVFVPTLTFVAAVNPVKYIGAEPIFMDCDDSLCLDPEKLESFIINHCKFDGRVLTNINTNRVIKAIIVVHVFGNFADMEAIMNLAKKYHLIVIEDATEALGTYYTSGRYKGQYAGTIGDIGVYSFNGNKIITTGGGGMVVSNDSQLADYVKHLSTQAKVDTLRFIHDEIGYNYRMTNVQAAMGLAQLEKLEEFIATKIENYNLYCELLNSNSLSLLGFKKDTRSNHWFYSIDLSKSNVSYELLMNYLQDKKIQTRPIWALIHNLKPYVEAQAYEIKKAVYYQERILNLPCSTNLSKEDVRIVCEAIKKFIA